MHKVQRQNVATIYFVVIYCIHTPCSERGRLVLNTCIPIRLFTLEFANNTPAYRPCFDKSFSQLVDFQTQLGNVNPVVRVPSGPISSAVTTTTFPHSETSCRSRSFDSDATVRADYALLLFFITPYTAAHKHTNTSKIRSKIQKGGAFL